MTSRPARLRIRIALLLGMLLVLGGAAAASAAALSTSFPGVGRTAHGHGDGIRGGDQVTLSMPVGGLAPGETSHGRQVLANDEGQSLRYALESASVNADHKGVRDVLQVTIRLADPASGAAATCDAFDGALVYEGPLGADTAGFGDARMGQQSGDRILAPGQRETLCIEITMPLDAGNAYQGAATSTTWTIAAEQVEGNP